MSRRIRLRSLRRVACAAAAALAGCSLFASGVNPRTSESLASRYAGYLYVAKRTTSIDAILVYAPGAAKPAKVIREGVGGAIYGPQGMTFDASGNLYVATENGSEVAVYGPGKIAPSYKITSGVKDAYALSTDSAGNLYALNCPNCILNKQTDQGSISVYAPGKSTPSYTIVAGIHNPIASAVDRSDNLYVANCWSPPAQDTCRSNYYKAPGQGSVTVYRRGKTTSAYTITNGVDAPRSVAVDASGNLYVANLGDSEIAVYPAGATTPSYDILLGIFDGVYPASMTFDEKGNLYVAKCAFGATGRICVFPPGSGTAIAYLQTPENWNPEIIAFTPSGNLYALELGIDVIKSAPDHQGQVAVAVYPPGSGTASRLISTGENDETAMAVSP
jgi:sugar lactone lactonase YvrE